MMRERDEGQKRKLWDEKKKLRQKGGMRTRGRQRRGGG